MRQLGSDRAPDHYFTFGDVYETMEACNRLDVLLARLKRQQLLPDDECAESRQKVATIRERLEAKLNSSSLTPKGPRLP